MTRKAGAILAVVLIGAVFAMTGCGNTAADRPPEGSSAAGHVESGHVDFGESGTPRKPETVVVAESIASFRAPASMPLYELAVQTPLTRESMEDLAGSLRLADPVELNARSLANSDYLVEFPGGDDATCFTLTKKGGIDRYLHMIDSGTEVPPCPSDEDAARVADQQLQALGFADVQRIGIEVQDSITSSMKDAAEARYDLTKVVSYQSSVGGLPLLGPGAKVSVTVGPDAELLRMKHWVRPSTPGPDVSLRSASLAVGDIEAGRGLPPVRMDSASLANIRVTGVTLAYWAEPVPLGESFYKPVYVFEVLGGDGSAGEWIVEAADVRAEIASPTTEQQ